jgi:hypothetical protein
VPLYKVQPEQDYPEAVNSPAKKKEKRYPTVYLPVSPEIIEALKVDQAVEVNLKGFVCGLESRQSSDPGSYNNKNEIRVELRMVEAYPTEGGDEPEEKEPSMKDAIDEGLGYAPKA